MRTTTASSVSSSCWTVDGERRSARRQPPSQASASGSGPWRHPWRCGRLSWAGWRVRRGRSGGIARCGPVVGVALGGRAVPGRPVRQARRSCGTQTDTTSPAGPACANGEGAHAVEGRGLAIDGAGGRPGGAPGELVLADLVGGQRGGPRLAAKEDDEMGDPAAGGARGPELPDVVVLEVGVAELAQGRPLGAEGARGRCRCAGRGRPQRRGPPQPGRQGSPIPPARTPPAFARRVVVLPGGCAP